jgi:hypothetical protein
LRRMTACLRSHGGTTNEGIYPFRPAPVLAISDSQGCTLEFSPTTTYVRRFNGDSVRSFGTNLLKNPLRPGAPEPSIATSPPTQGERFIAKWKPLYPSAVARVEDNLDALGRPPAVPERAPKRIRDSNFIQRTFGETRRRVKVIGRLPGEQSCFVWAVLDRASKGWRGITMTPKILRRLQDLRRDG